MSTSLKDFQVKHLFLLVGENPLPNYVAACKLLEKGGKAYLVYTKQTQPQKNALVRGLNDVGIKSEPVDLVDFKADAPEIYTRVDKKAKDLDGRVGLNYTGGTNVMAVHAYRALLDCKKPEIFCSYLDSRTLRMYVDRPGIKPFWERVELEVSLKQIFDLHDFKCQEKQVPLPKPKLQDAAAEFVRLYQDEKIAKTWRDWCKNELRKAKAPETDYWLYEENLAKLKLNLTGVHPEIINVLRAHLNASKNQLDIQKSQTENFNNLKQLFDWLNGIWLEHYVLQQIQSIPAKLNIYDSQMSFHIKNFNDNKPWRTADKFEFDVAFTRSYQLFALSCTTSSSLKNCKLKLFEAYTRARQLGGDEARVALVCCCDDNFEKYSKSVAEYLKSQLEGTLTNHKIAVFSRKDLPNLASGIAKWIERIEQEAK